MTTIAYARRIDRPHEAVIFCAPRGAATAHSLCAATFVPRAAHACAVSRIDPSEPIGMLARIRSRNSSRLSSGSDTA